MDLNLLITILVGLVGYGITRVLALKAVRTRKPVWAYTTTRMTGNDAKSPPEPRLVSGGEAPNDVYRTKVLFFNAGNEAIRRDDITDRVTILFKGAQILQEPVIKSTSKVAIRFSAKKVVCGGDSGIELDFLYLSRNDGALVEVVHTPCAEVNCVGNIIDSDEIRCRNEFSQLRSSDRASIGGALVPFWFLGAIVWGIASGDIRYPMDRVNLSLFIFTCILCAVLLWSDTIPFFRQRRFPRWVEYRE